MYGVQWKFLNNRGERRVWGQWELLHNKGQGSVWGQWELLHNKGQRSVWGQWELLHNKGHEKHTQVDLTKRQFLYAQLDVSWISRVFVYE